MDAIDIMQAEMGSAEEGGEEAGAMAEGLLGKHTKHRYENGWAYDVHYKAGSLMDYTVLEAKLKGRRVEGQAIEVREVGQRQFLVTWVEPTGTCVSQLVDLRRRVISTAAFFPAWVQQRPHETVCFQNEHLPCITHSRDAGPTYPIHMLTASGTIFFCEQLPADDDHQKENRACEVKMNVKPNETLPS